MRVLALDYGSARCGCAVSDPTGVLATPLEPVARPDTRRGLARLRALVAELGAERVVVGLPLSLSGRDSAQTAETRAFAARARAASCRSRSSSTTSASRRGWPSGPAAGPSEDSRAAAHLLESWLALASRMASEVAPDGSPRARAPGRERLASATRPMRTDRGPARRRAPARRARGTRQRRRRARRPTRRQRRRPSASPSRPRKSGRPAPAPVLALALAGRRDLVPGRAFQPFHGSPHGA